MRIVRIFFISFALQCFFVLNIFCETQRKFNTIAHSILDLDSKVHEVNQDHYSTVDHLIDEAIERIPQNLELNRENGLFILGEIDKILTENNFVCSLPEKVELLSDGLNAKVIEESTMNSICNKNREPHITAHRKGLFKHIDCDLGCMLYLAIADILKYPLWAIEIPDHNLLCLDLKDGGHIFWETNYGLENRNIESTEKYYKYEFDIQRHLRRKLSQNEFIGYYMTLIGNQLKKQFKYLEAEKCYKNAIELHPNYPEPKNGLAWMYCTVEGNVFAEKVEEAIQLAIASIRLDPYNDWYADTLACAYAASGRFGIAQKIQKIAIAILQGKEYLSDDDKEDLKSYINRLELYQKDKRYIKRE